MKNLMEDDLKLAEIKQQSLRKLFDQTQAEANSIISFTLQWKDLADHFEAMRSFLSKQGEELSLQEKKLVKWKAALEKREEEIETKGKNVEERLEEIQSKEKDLGFIRKSIQECTLELDSKENRLSLARKELEECNAKLSSKRAELGFVQRNTKECNKELDAEKKQLDMVRRSARETSWELELKNEALGLVNEKLKDCHKALSLKDEQLRSVRKSLEECGENLKFKEKEVEKVMILIAKCNSDLELKDQEVYKKDNLIRARDGELELKEMELEALQKRIKDCSNEVELKRKELGGIEQSIEESQKELDLKKEELNGTQKLIEDHRKALGSVEKELSRIQMLIEEKTAHLVSEENHLDSIKVLVEEYKEELQNKEKQHDALEKLINGRSVELKAKESLLELIKKSTKKQSMELREGKEKVDSLQNRSIQCGQELENKEDELNSLKGTLKGYCKDIELKEREFNAIQMSIKNRSEELKLKESLLESVKTSIEKRRGELEKMRAEKDLVQKAILDCSEELKSKQNNLDLLSKSLKECCEELESKITQLESVQSLEERLENIKMKEKHFEEIAKEFESKEKQYDSLKKSVEQCCKELEVKEKQLNDALHSREKAEQCEDFSAQLLIDSLSASLHSPIEGNGRKLQLLLNELLALRGFVHHVVFSALQNSKDPATLVLDAMQGFYPPGLNMGDVQFDLSVIRRSCIILLEKMQKMSLEISPQAREEAMNLANEWRAKITGVPENLLEVLGFLQLVAAFKMASAFNANELLGLLDILSHRTHTSELQQALGIADASPRSNVFSSQANIEELGDSQVNNPACSLSNCQSSATSEEKSLKLVLNEAPDVEDLTQDEISFVFRMSTDPAKLVLDLMHPSFSQLWEDVDIGLDASFTRTKVLLLEQLMMVVPKITPQVKEAAKGLAVLWKAKTRLDKEDSMEVLAFLLFLAIYQLVPCFRADEIIGLIEIVVQHKQAPHICQALGFADKIPSFIQLLCQRKQFMEAARFSCTFGLAKKFPPELIFKAYLDNARAGACRSVSGKNLFESQCLAIDNEVAALKVILEFTADYKLDSRFLIENIVAHIANVVKPNAGMVNSWQFPTPIVQSNIEGRNYRSVGVTGPRDQSASPPVVHSQLHNQVSRVQPQQWQNNKRPRVDIPAERPYLSQVSTPIDPYSPSVITPPGFPYMLPPAVCQLGSSAEVHGGLTNVGYAGNLFSTAESSTPASNAGGRQMNT